MVVGKNLVLVLAKVSPVIGVLAIFTSIQATGTNGSTTGYDLWRIAMTALVAAFVTLAGAIYQNMNRRIEILEKAKDEAPREYLRREEYEQRHKDMKEQMNRIENAVKRH